MDKSGRLKLIKNICERNAIANLETSLNDEDFSREQEQAAKQLAFLRYEEEQEQAEVFCGILEAAT